MKKGFLAFVLAAVAWLAVFVRPALADQPLTPFPSPMTPPTSRGGASGTVTGTGTAGAVTFWTGVTTLGADGAKFFWDDTNVRLGIGTNAPGVEIDVTKAQVTPTKIEIKNTTSAANASAEYDVISDVAQGHFGAYSTGYTHVASMALSFGLLAETGTHSVMRFDTPDTDEPIQFVQGAQQRFQMTNSGNLIVPENQGAIMTTPISSTNSALDFLNAMGSSLGSSAYTIAVRTTSNTGNATVAFFANSTTWEGSIRADSSGDIAIVAAGASGDVDMFSGGDFGTGTFFAQLGPTRADWKTTPQKYGETTAPSSAASNSVLYADSTAHAAELSNNNDAFDAVARAASNFTSSPVTENAAALKDTAITTLAVGNYQCHGEAVLSESTAADGAKCAIVKKTGTWGSGSSGAIVITSTTANTGDAGVDNGATMAPTTSLSVMSTGVCITDATIIVSAGGNAALQVAQNSHSTGTLTAQSGASLRCTRM